MKRISSLKALNFHNLNYVQPTRCFCSSLLSFECFHIMFHSLLYVSVFMVTDFSHDNTLFTLPPGAHNHRDLSSYSQPSHHTFQQYQLGGIPEGHSLKSDSGLMTGAALWDMENVVQSASFSGGSGHQPGSSHAGGTELHCVRFSQLQL